MSHEELAAWLRLVLTPGVGNDAGRRLLAAFGLPQAIFDQTASALRQVVSAAQTSALLSPPTKLPAQVQATHDWLTAGDSDGTQQRRLVTLGDPLYPASLLNLEDPPLMLYLLGQVRLLGAQPNLASAPVSKAPDASHSIANSWPTKALAMVGSRNPTPQGAQNARQFAKALSDAGLTVVSGLALGIDGAAHEGALVNHLIDTPASRLRTLAVIGTGIDRVYPRQHRDLAHRVATHGLIVSEYPLGTPPLAANFPKRNRLIAGLSSGTLVVEAALQSGSLITARLTAEQGKEVLAIPGSIHSPQSRGCHALIRQGAKLVETATDILEELPWPEVSSTTNKIADVTDAASASPASNTHSDLLQALGADPVSLDALQARTGLDTATLQAHLLELELQGAVGRLPGGLFQRMGLG
ncbi:DNA-processing protein DprA [Ottowia sp.]|uniref:DNA-processing protein DprA n=1 Tax=Ottowia sp. TaxID=1898956 RepID=UPI003A88E736